MKGAGWVTAVALGVWPGEAGNAAEDRFIRFQRLVQDEPALRAITVDWTEAQWLRVFGALDLCPELEPKWRAEDPIFSTNDLARSLTSLVNHEPDKRIPGFGLGVAAGPVQLTTPEWMSLRHIWYRVMVPQPPAESRLARAASPSAATTARPTGDGASSEPEGEGAGSKPPVTGPDQGGIVVAPEYTEPLNLGGPYVTPLPREIPTHYETPVDPGVEWLGTYANPITPRPWETDTTGDYGGAATKDIPDLTNLTMATPGSHSGAPYEPSNIVIVYPADGGQLKFGDGVLDVDDIAGLVGISRDATASIYRLPDPGGQVYAIEVQHPHITQGSRVALSDYEHTAYASYYGADETAEFQDLVLNAARNQVDAAMKLRVNMRIAIPFNSRILKGLINLGFDGDLPRELRDALPVRLQMHKPRSFSALINSQGGLDWLANMAWGERVVLEFRGP